MWLPNWPIQRLVVAVTALRRTQIVLYRNQPGRGQIVTAVSPAAELSGARIGMPLSEAKSLVGRSRKFDDYHVFEHNPSADLRTLQQLAMDCQRFSPVVGLEEAVAPPRSSIAKKAMRSPGDWHRDPPSSILMDVTGLTHLFGGCDGIRAQVHRYFQDLGYLVSTAIAPTVGMAWGLARFEVKDHADIASDDALLPSREQQETSTARTEPRPPHRTALAVQQEKAPPLLPVPTSDLQFKSRFDSLPVAALRLQEETVDTLGQLGIHTITQIRSLPRAGLRSRFGDEITWRLDQASGVIDELITAIYPPPDYHVEKFLDYPLNDRETIQVIMSRLAGQLCREMRAGGRGGLVWQFCLSPPPEGRDSLPDDPEERDAEQSATKPVELTIKLFRPTASLDHLMPLVEMQMESLFRKPGRSTRKKHRRSIQRLDFQVQEVAVSVRNCVLLGERQRKLFDENPRLDKQALAHLINRLSSRLGCESVLRPVLQSGSQAEDTFYFESLVGQVKTRNRRSPSRHRNAVSPLQRPLVLYPEPVEIQAVALDATGDRHDEKTTPAMFLCDNQRLRVTRRWGPERIETAWWRGPTVRRDYWRVETHTNRWLWIYRNLQNRRWYLHGEF